MGIMRPEIPESALRGQVQSGFWPSGCPSGVQVNLHFATRSIYLAIIIALVVGSFSYIPTAAQDTPPATSSLLVKLINGLSPAEQGAVIARNGGNEVNSIVALRLHVIEVPAADEATILQKYQADPQVQSAEVNKKRRVEGI